LDRLSPRFEFCFLNFELMTGRLAPSPTGYLHLGNARSFLLAWLQMRAMGGRIILRIEDLDQPRAVAGADAMIVEDLRWLGLDWDNELAPEYFQSNRFEIYRATIDRLRHEGHLYECFCSRRELRQIASAPHGPTGARYSGKCRDLTARERAARWEEKDPALRFRVEPGSVITFHDLVVGIQSEDVSEVTGDFIIARADGIPSYQLAVVVDDIAMGVTHVVRGADLLPSTPRQILLYHTLAAPEPVYAHVPLMLGRDGARLAKRHGAVSLAELRSAGRRAEEIVGWLGWSVGLLERNEPCTARELVDGFDITRIGTAPTVIDAEP
jgi:glutamyl-tRNA synthetase